MNNLFLYVTPPQRAYVVMKPFWMPTKNGPLWAVALPTSSAQFVNAALSVVLTIMFTWLWGLIASATLYFASHRFSRRRLVTLVALRNSPDPWAACKALAGLTAESMGCFRPKRHGRPSTWRDTAFACAFATLALSVVATAIVIGIIGPPFFMIGNVAPVETSKLYYPRSSSLTSNPQAYRALRAEPSLRALSSVQLFGKTIRERVEVSGDESVRTTDPTKPMFGLTYRYNITGLELGLKHATDLMLSVRGACRTEYGWLDTTNKNEAFERLHIFNDPNMAYTTALSGVYLEFPPRPGFLTLNESLFVDQTLAGNVSYAIVAPLSNRRSNSSGTDPWYLTEPHISNNLKLNTQYRIKAGRPALSCWHQDVWSCCGGESVNGGRNLPELKNLIMPEVLRDIMAIALLKPPVVQLGKDAVMSALASASSSPLGSNGIIEARYSSIFQDVERLVMASYVSTLNILTDSTLFEPSDDEFKQSNYFTNPKTFELEEGVGDFVVPTPDVQTFNLIGLITVGCIIGLMLAMKVGLSAKVFWHRNMYSGVQHGEMDPNLEVSPFNRDRWARFKAFSAVHLLRNTYEDGTGAHEEDWRCGEDLPDPREEKPLWLAKCKHGDTECCGHIATDRKVLGLQDGAHHVKNDSISTIGDESFQSYAAGAQSFALPRYASPHQEYHDDLSSPDFLAGMGDGNSISPYNQALPGNPYFSQSTPPAPTNTRYQDDTTLHTAPLLPVYRYSSS
ncbi:hypothetical protein B0T25DRAFT_511246 [Lasiosphaeria hispida]|uniref:Uncharacterized protein n=1 Tax=Lasiosphaeria hispida TaxID=260671 RepID=A0AAJ0H766_9PEZI|nr:hypothetical protein B0T25DRAFT_511246 [Lasiosphaeria hispida]